MQRFSTSSVLHPQRLSIINFELLRSTDDPGVVIEDSVQAFQAAKDQASEHAKSLLSKREKTRVHSLAVKAREMKFGADWERCIREMRETAYNIGRSERANEKNRPAW